ncbi:MAG: ABC transporter ATP-binding protein [Nitrospirota bacterium]
MEPRITLHEVSKIFPLAGISGRELLSTVTQTAAFGDKIAVAGVSLTIQHGERLGIVGRNGAGKSTLLHLIAGLSSPTSGSIEIDGKVTSVMTLGVGLRDDLSGRENIYVDGEIQGKARHEIEQVIEEIIAFADLGEFIDFPVRTYSTGMKARLAFSMISHIDPEILIVDEALSVGDATFSAKATARIMEICARGKIVIIVSHGMQSIKDICNRCLWMENGHVVMDGSPEAVTKAYIDSVRTADEAKLMEKFRKFIGVRSMQAGWAITQVEIFTGESVEQRFLLEAWQPTRLEVRADIPVGNSDSGVRVRITRLDDLLVFDEFFPTEAIRLREQSIGLQIEMTPLVLGVAIYRLDVSLEAGEAVCAESSSIFEVFAVNPPAGGKPMLLYPVTGSAIPIDSLDEVR